MAVCSACGWTFLPKFAAPPEVGDTPAFLGWKAAVDERRKMEDARRAKELDQRRREDAAASGRLGLEGTLRKLEAWDPTSCSLSAACTRN